MQIEIGRAREMARELAQNSTGQEVRKPAEICEQLRMMADLLEVQCDRLSAARLALDYYQNAELYVASDSDDPSDEILDGGLRARTALAELDAPVERLQARKR